MTTNTYLHFNGNCKAAFDYYVRHLGAKLLMSMTFGDAPPSAGQNAGCSSMAKDKIMHGRLQIGNTCLMGCDCPPEHSQSLSGFTVNLSTDDPKEAERVFAALSDKGQVVMPLGETFWAKRFGMCKDQFGVPWMVNCEKERS